MIFRHLIPIFYTSCGFHISVL